MVDAMKKVASTDVELTVEERNLLSVAYKNVIGARRASWRIISSIEQKEENKGVEEKLEMIKNYRSQVEKELRDICSDILDVLDKHLIPCATTGESKVFYYKMKGDYHRYLAEFATGNDRKEAAENSLVAYKAASDIAMTDLPPTHPIRLGLALNFSVSFFSFLFIFDSAEKKIFFKLRFQTGNFISISPSAKLFPFNIPFEPRLEHLMKRFLERFSSSTLELRQTN